MKTFFLLCCLALSNCTTTPEIGIIPRISPGDTRIDVLQEDPPIPEPITILYTDTGYTPRNITVSPNTQVTFVNQSSLPMWTASDPHPVHTDYGDFDSKKALKTNESYTYVFTKHGSYGYHNHSKSLHRGVVRVYDKNAPTLPSKTLPGSLENRDRLLGLLTEDTSSIQTLFEIILADKKLANDCHDIAHDLGHRAYELFGFSGALLYNDVDKKTMAYVDDICAGGYMHGVLEELFLHDPTLMQHPDQACQGVPIGGRESCYHGVGHGIMFGFDRDLSKSVSACKGMSKKVAQHRCYEGVYMELFWGQVSHGTTGLGWDVKDPLKSCSEADSEASAACFLYGHLGYLRNHLGDFPGAMRLCTLGSLSEYEKNYCIKGIGITLMKRFSSRQLNQVETFTMTLNEGEKIAFYDGVIGYSLLSGLTAEGLKDICHAMKTDQSPCMISLEKVAGTKK